MLSFFADNHLFRSKTLRKKWGFVSEFRLHELLWPMTSWYRVTLMNQQFSQRHVAPTFQLSLVIGRWSKPDDFSTNFPRLSIWTFPSITKLSFHELSNKSFSVSNFSFTLCSDCANLQLFHASLRFILHIVTKSAWRPPRHSFHSLSNSHFY